MKCKVIPDFLTPSDIEAITLGIQETIDYVPDPLLAVESIERKGQIEWSEGQLVAYEQDDGYIDLESRRCRTTNLTLLISVYRDTKIRKKLKQAVKEHWNEIAFDGKMSNNSPNINAVAYRKGDRFKWHYDRRPEPPINPSIEGRRISFSIIVQNATKGGELEFDEQPDFDLKPGTLILFDSRIYHRVAEIKEGTRISLVGWWFKEEVEVVSNATN